MKHKILPKVLMSIMYHRINNEVVSADMLMKMIQREGWKVSNTHARLAYKRMLSAGWIHVIQDNVYLTERGLRHAEKQHKILMLTTYGMIADGSSASIKSLCFRLAKIIHRITQLEINGEEIVRLFLKRLRREGAVDYSGDRVWIVKNRK